ncbi:methyltransferase domain-containing protein [uncultured Methylovirgula sp.]|uniref:methyltransferase domain-containing protein n=1 Tax=uncultured Methylovirgula sp. TaxID=1285960 RepID=UPI00260FD95F|nr:methyltransferase domain-containing protein [uncultured Methylovirgula sp.]
MNWRNLWRGDRASRAGERFPAVYYEDIAKAIAAQIPAPAAVMLDYGCGSAPAAALVAEHCATLYLYEPAPKMQAALRQRYAGNSKIKVLNDAQVKALPDMSLDMVLFNALFQYLTLAQCTEAVDFAAVKLRLGGRLVVADVIPPHADPLSDSWALVEYAYRGGFLLAALRGALSRRRPLRRRAPLTTFTIPDMQRLLATHGFETRRADRNIGHNQMHMTFLAKRV